MTTSPSILPQSGILSAAPPFFSKARFHQITSDFFQKVSIKVIAALAFISLAAYVVRRFFNSAAVAAIPHPSAQSTKEAQSTKKAAPLQLGGGGGSKDLTFSQLRNEVGKQVSDIQASGIDYVKKAKQENFQASAMLARNQASFEVEGQSSSVVKFSNGGEILIGSIMPAVEGNSLVVCNGQNVQPNSIVLVQGRQRMMDSKDGAPRKEMPHDIFNIPMESRHYFAEALKEEYADCTKDYFSEDAGKERIKSSIQFYVDMLRQGKRIYTHCSSGKDRSAALALGALLYINGDSSDNAYSSVLNLLIKGRMITNDLYVLEHDEDSAEAQENFHSWYITPIRAAVAEMLEAEAAAR